MGARESNKWGVRCLIAAASVLMLGFGAAHAVADSVVVLELQAANEEGAGTYRLFTDGMSLRDGGGYCTYNFEGEYVITDPTTGAEVATLKELSVCYVEDPAINLHFSVVAGASTTTFTITSALQAVNPPIPASIAQGRATSAFSVTDGVIGAPGATLTGLEQDGFAYTARYNGFVGAGTPFASQISQIAVVPPDRSRAESVNDPDPDPTHYRAVGAAINDMSAEIKFSLTARDMASGSTTYEIIPEPAALLLLALGALSLGRRRA